MAGQYTSQANGCLLQSFGRTVKDQLAGPRGGQEANANTVVSISERENPKDLMSFSIDTQNLGA